MDVLSVEWGSHRFVGKSYERQDVMKGGFSLDNPPQTRTIESGVTIEKWPYRAWGRSATVQSPPTTTTEAVRDHKLPPVFLLPPVRRPRESWPVSSCLPALLLLGSSQTGVGPGGDGTSPKSENLRITFDNLT